MLEACRVFRLQAWLLPFGMPSTATGARPKLCLTPSQQTWARASKWQPACGSQHAPELTARLSPACATYSVLPMRNAHTAVVPYRLPLQGGPGQVGASAGEFGARSSRGRSSAAWCCCIAQPSRGAGREATAHTHWAIAQGACRSRLSAHEHSLVDRRFHNLLVHVFKSLLQRRLHRRHVARVALRGTRGRICQ